MEVRRKNGSKPKTTIKIIPSTSESYSLNTSRFLLTIKKTLKFFIGICHLLQASRWHVHVVVALFVGVWWAKKRGDWDAERKHCREKKRSRGEGGMLLSCRWMRPTRSIGFNPSVQLLCVTLQYMYIRKRLWLSSYYHASTFYILYCTYIHVCTCILCTTF